MGLVEVAYVGYPDASVRIAWLDRLKIASAFAVVMTHIASIPWQVASVESSAWFISSVYEILTRFCVPAFFFATGAVLLNPNKGMPTAKIVRYALRALLCALLVSALYVMLEVSFDGWFGWADFIRRAVDGPYFIWYLWVLVGLYVLVPILRHIAQSERILTYACVVLFIFVIGKSTAIAMAPDSLVNVVYGNMILFNRGAEAVFYSLLGAWCISHRLSRGLENAVMLCGTVAGFVAIWMNWEAARALGPDLYYANRDNLLICLYFFGVVVAFSRWAAPRPLLQFEQYICGCGLMIYLIHPFFRLLFERMDLFSGHLHGLMANPIIGVPVVSLACYVLSIVVAILIKVIAGARASHA